MHECQAQNYLLHVSHGGVSHQLARIRQRGYHSDANIYTSYSDYGPQTLIKMCVNTL